MKEKLTRPIRFRLDDTTDDALMLWATSIGKNKSDLMRHVLRRAVRKEQARQRRAQHNKTVA